MPKNSNHSTAPLRLSGPNYAYNLPFRRKNKRKNKKYIKKLCVPLIYRSDINRHIGHKPIRIINMASFTIHRPNMWNISFLLKKKKKKKKVQFHFYTFVHDFHFFYFFILTLSPPTVRMLKAFQAQCPMSNICSKCTLTHTHTFIHSLIHSGVAAVALNENYRCILALHR